MRELRVNGRELTGTAVEYGDVARVYDPTRRIVINERIEAGAFGDIGTVVLELEHRSDRPIAMQPGALTLTDNPERLELRADLPHIADADALIAGVRTGEIGGLSVDMDVHSDRLDASTRIIERATLNRVAAVSTPAYPQSTAELRQRIATIRAGIPVGTSLGCGCVGGGCDSIVLRPGSLDAQLDRRLAVITSDYGAGRVGEARISRERRGYSVLASLLDSPESLAILNQIDTFGPGVLLRPLFNEQRSTFDKQGQTASFLSMAVQAFLLKSAPDWETSGWPSVERAAEQRRELLPWR